ncbi:MAG: hypothetical protein ABS46_20775 [Cytophagaceae bacterium SCN 52-12]|nr:MAG: hypothetical protein ABS46_20775 [Cytophagaceae bacterium SCN 52-12]
MKGDQENIRKLFAKYLAGECTPEEKSAVMTFFDQEGNEEYVRTLIREEFGKDIPIGESSVRAMQDVYRHFKWTAGQKSAPRFRLHWPAAFRPAIAAAWIGALICAAFIAYIYYPAYIASGPTLATVTALGERKMVKLDDGSVVWLNAASRLTYPGRFTGGTREVSLEGEAFFDIARNEDQPFVIKSGALKTTVLGTSFNIRAYREDKTMSVAVVTGKVRVTSPEAELHLEPNQQAVFDKKRLKLDKKQEMSVSEMVSWKEGMLRFRNTTFSEVTAVLRRSRGASIGYNRRLENCPIIHADFNEGDSLESILGTLMMAVNGSVEKTGDGEYYLTSDIDCQP